VNRISASGITALLVTAAMSGCGGMTDQQRLKKLVPNAERTMPVRGKVLVDGKPVKDLIVKLHPPDESPRTLVPNARTADDGTFSVTSYIGGDGAPRGKYKVTVEWLTYQQLGNQWRGPNKLLDKYGGTETTPFDVAVTDQPVDLPTYNVEAKSGAKK
jgi:hypothetical protein